MDEKIIKHIKNIEKLCKVEKFILENGRPIDENDKEILSLIETVMDDYQYGWYITDDKLIWQLINISKFKIYILELME